MAGYDLEIKIAVNTWKRNHQLFIFETHSKNNILLVKLRFRREHTV